MKSNKSLLAVSLFCAFLGGCAYTFTDLEGPQAALKINDKTSKVLLGEFKYLSVKVVNNTFDTTAQLHVSDGSYECTGIANYEENTSKSIQLPITCTDGRTGNIILNFSKSLMRADQRGIGVGTLNDGTKVRLILGNLTGSIAW